MRDLIKQEQFELEVLDKLNSARLLKNLVFTGGTMLRLCYELNRFSVDLDFWIVKEIDVDKLFSDVKNHLSQHYLIKDAENKFFTLLFEMKSPAYPRNLKIEIRKSVKRIKTQTAIAYSKYSNIQVLVRVPTLEEVLKAKIEAFLNRKEIRDAFDIEFLVKRGISLNIPKETCLKLLSTLNELKPMDYKVKLGSILESKQRSYYIQQNFRILKMKLQQIIHT